VEHRFGIATSGFVVLSQTPVPHVGSVDGFDALDTSC
jgi:hypothetical protein